MMHHLIHVERENPPVFHDQTTVYDAVADIGTSGRIHKVARDFVERSEVGAVEIHNDDIRRAPTEISPTTEHSNPGPWLRWERPCEGRFLREAR